MGIIYKTFECGHCYYVYDRNFNAIIRISKDDYDALSLPDTDSKKATLMKKYQSHGFLTESKLKHIENPFLHFLEPFEQRHCYQLILQVTQDCNLRCEYCFYVNEAYLGRKYSEKNMSFETAKKAIDFFLKNSIANKEVSISFYGGEPLLRMVLIEQCVEYVKKNLQDRKAAFSLTTNGTLLTLDKAKFFSDNKFNIMISLDGAKENHNTHRVFPNGKGSFDVIIKNLESIKEHYPEFFKCIQFNCVVSPDSDYKSIREYVENSNLLKDSVFATSLLQDNYTTANIVYDDKLVVDTSYGEFKSLLYMLGRLNDDDVSIVFKPYIIKYRKLESLLKEHVQMPESAHHGGPCVVGAKRLFVDVSGRFFPCERVSESSDKMIIGNIDEGIFFDKVARLINYGKQFETPCLNCWAFNHCKICPSEVDDLNGFSADLQLKKCYQVKEHLLSDLKDICTLNYLKKIERHQEDLQ